MTLKVQTLTLAFFLLCSIFTFLATAQNRTETKQPAEAAKTGGVRARALQELVDAAAREAITRFADKGFKEQNLAITLIDLRDSEHPMMANFRGEERIYPASVVKLFYLAAAHR